jgi:hypothetical protein
MCPQQRVPTADLSAPAVKTYHPKTKDEDGMIMSHPLTVYQNLCYYHKKKREGIIGGNFRYPRSTGFWRG